MDTIGIVLDRVEEAAHFDTIETTIVASDHIEGQTIAKLGSFRAIGTQWINQRNLEGAMTQRDIVLGLEERKHETEEQKRVEATLHD